MTCISTTDNHHRLIFHFRHDRYYHYLTVSNFRSFLFIIDGLNLKKYENLQGVHFFAFLLKLCVVNFACNCQVRDEIVIHNYFDGMNLGRVNFCVLEMFVKHVLCFQKISVNFQPKSVVYLALNTT